MDISRSSLKAFRTEMDGLFSVIKAKHNIQMKVGSIAYDNTGFRFKVEVVNAGTKQEAEKIEFEKYASLYGLTSNDFMKEIHWNGKQFVICGFKPRSKYYPIIAMAKNDGKKYVLPERALKQEVKNEIEN